MGSWRLLCTETKGTRSTDLHQCHRASTGTGDTSATLPSGGTRSELGVENVAGLEMCFTQVQTSIWKQPPSCTDSVSLHLFWPNSLSLSLCRFWFMYKVIHSTGHISNQCYLALLIQKLFSPSQNQTQRWLQPLCWTLPRAVTAAVLIQQICVRHWYPVHCMATLKGCCGNCQLF